MQRPIKRPEQKITAREILNMAHTHFVTDKSPRSVARHGTCVYTGCGCWVGFMLTEADAKAMPIGSVPAYWREMDPVMRKILSHYFDLDDRDTMQVLVAGQRFHDGWGQEGEGVTPAGFRHGIRSFCHAMRVALAVFTRPVATAP